MEKDPSEESFATLIYTGGSSRGAYQQPCKCHRSLTIVCVVLCTLTSLLALCCTVFTCAAVIDVSSLRVEVRTLHDAGCTPCESVAGPDSGDARSAIALELLESETAAEDEIIQEIPDALDGIAVEAVHTTDEDRDGEIDGSGDDFILLQDDEMEEDEEDSLRRLTRSTIDSNQDGNGKRNRKRDKGKKPKKGRKSGGGKKMKSLLAAQFEATVTDEFIEQNIPKYDHNVNTEGCRHFAAMDGSLCRNKSFTPDDDDVTTIFHPSPWVTNKGSPLSVTSPGVYTARARGVYLVYAQVMFSDPEPIKGAIVEQIRQHKTTKLPHRIQKLLCNQGLVLFPDMDDEIVMQSCTVIGLFKMRPGDVLRIRSENRYSKIERSDGSTYFGVVQLNRDR